MIFSFSKKFIFIHIHKVGGSSIEQVLEPHMQWSDLVLGSSEFGEAINFAYKRRFDLYKHSSLSDIERICGSKYLDDFFCFALVRHPIERVCSLYNWTAGFILDWACANNIDPAKLGDHINDDLPESSPLAWPTSKAYITTRDFSGYIRSEYLKYEDGFKSQVSRLRSSETGAIRAQALAIEESSNWLPSLSDKLGIFIELPHINKSKRKLVEATSLRKSDVRYLEELFEEDFCALRY